LNKALLVILGAVTLDAIGIGLIFPILPGLLKELAHAGEVSALYGVILAIYAAMQFLFSPILGVMSDRYGRRPVLLVSLAGAALDYVVMALAPALWLLVVSRAIAGLTSANMAVATAYITDITPEGERARRFGYFHAMFGIGFIVGPVLGGALGDWWIRAPFFAAALLNAANFALALFVLPETHRPAAPARFDWSALNPFQPLRWALSFRALLPMIAVFVIFNFVGQIYGTVWALYGGEQLDWSGLWIGISLGAYGLLHALVQALLPGPVSERLGERATLILGIACETVALAAVAVTGSGWVVFAVMPLFALGGVGVPALQSLMTAVGVAGRQGLLQGVLAAVGRVSAVAGPLFFSEAYLALKPYWPGGIWMVGGAIYVLTLPLLLSLRPRVPRPAGA
jgi:DHA1 family tetracycline resistance protein-like MFS transporter